MFEKKCRETGEIIRSGRSDKKFINDKARSKYHNKIRSEKARNFKQIDKQLHLNYEILDKYYKESNGEPIHLSTLEEEGFDFKVYLGTPIGTDSDYPLPDLFYSYEYRYTFHKEVRKIIINKIPKF